MQRTQDKFKVVVVGDTFTGKTSIINRACFDTAPLEDEQTTIGAKTTEYTPKLPNNSCTLSIWDTAGQERYRSIVPMYFREARLIIIVFDITKRQTFEDLPFWLSSIRDSVGEKVPILFIGNKLDLIDERNVSHMEAREWSENLTGHKIVAYMETSAQTGEGISEVFELAAEYLLSEEQRGTDTAVISPADGAKKGCC